MSFVLFEADAGAFTLILILNVLAVSRTLLSQDSVMNILKMGIYVAIQAVNMLQVSNPCRSSSHLMIWSPSLCVGSNCCEAMQQVADSVTIGLLRHVCYSSQVDTSASGFANLQIMSSQ